MSDEQGALPEEVAINAYAGDQVPVTSRLAQDWSEWALVRRVEEPRKVLFAKEADLNDWSDPEVGWGLVLPDDDAKSEGERAAGDDAPAPIRELLAARLGSPVFRYRQQSWQAQFLRRYYPDRSPEDVAISGGERGVGPGRLPRYLLICASPEQIPWKVQYRLNPSCFVGRLALPASGLRNYVDFLLGKKAPLARPERPVVWGVDHGPSDITWLMRHAIAEPVCQALRKDSQIGAGARCLTGEQATCETLLAALREASPGLVVTTSHGMTGPVEDQDRMRADLGLLVDRDHRVLRSEAVLDAWQPEGAIWYAHACCSAGSDAKTRYKGLIEGNSRVETVLEAVAAVGAQVAPFPTALLSARRPLGAFIGHVEPTFDWTLRNPGNRQVLTAALRHALYGRLYSKRPQTVGFAFQGCYGLVGELYTQWAEAIHAANGGKPEYLRVAARSQLAALDRQAMVILGDPTIALAPLPESTFGPSSQV
jgi:hypothetical protein